MSTSEPLTDSGQGEFTQCEPPPAAVQVAVQNETETSTSTPDGLNQHQGEFTTENFKLEIKNLPKYYGYLELKKLFNRLGLNARKIKMMSRGDFTFVNFDSDEERSRALEKLNGYEWKGKKLQAVFAKPAEDPLLRKRKAEESTDQDETGNGIPKSFSDRKHRKSEQNPQRADKPEAEDAADVSTAVKNAVLPWWNVPYNEQIDRKSKDISQFVNKLTNELCKLNREFVGLQDPETHLICKVEPILVSPSTTEYRNKCEFTIGYNPETNEPTVGFRLACYRHGSTGVGPIEESLYHLPQLMIKAALAFQDYIRQSEYKPFDLTTKQGTWRQLTVRTTLDGQLMMIVLINCSLTEVEVKSLQENLTTHFQSQSDLPITSFYFKEQEKAGSKTKNTPVLLFGQSRITETLLGLQFRISPEAFFQINPKATEIMYRTIQALAETDQDTALLDVCCGTGTIGLCLASSCGQILGVEIIPDAINDAKYNANSNALLDKCDFFTGKAEDVVDILITKSKCRKIVAVVDPPRPGVNIKVIQSLRRCEQITTVVFAFCDANAAIKNFLDLGRPTSKAYRGEPFILEKIVPVDLFPGTPHYELVALFKR